MKCNIILYVAILALSLTIQPVAMASSFDFEPINLPGVESTEACDINNQGQVVGRYWDLDGGHGFLFKKGSFTAIDFPGALNTFAYGINDQGQVVGGCWYPDVGQGFFLDRGSFTTISFPRAGNTEAYGINDREQIVGYYQDVNLIGYGFLLDRGSFTTISFPGASYTYAYNINNRGQIVGSYADGNGAYGFLLDKDSFITIAPPGAWGTIAMGISEHEQIVGSYHGEFPLPFYGFIATRAHKAPPATLALESRTRPVSVRKGDRFSLRIVAKHVTEMHKFSFKLVFDPDVLEVEKVERSPFSSWRPRPRFIEAADVCVRPVVDNSTGSVTIACDSTRAGGVSGSGEIATISSHAIGPGPASFGFDAVSVVDSRGKSIDVELSVPEIQVTEFHPMDINHDGIVNILDFVAIASEKEGNAQAAPSLAQTALGQNYPNPFNPDTWIPYQLAEDSEVTVRIYSATGQLIRVLNVGYREAGLYVTKDKAAYWDGRNASGEQVASGVYFYQLVTPTFQQIRRMVMLQ